MSVCETCGKPDSTCNFCGVSLEKGSSFIESVVVKGVAICTSCLSVAKHLVDTTSEPVVDIKHNGDLA